MMWRAKRLGGLKDKLCNCSMIQELVDTIAKSAHLIIPLYDQSVIVVLLYNQVQDI